jgi:hypothetical protein
MLSLLVLALVATVHASVVSRLGDLVFIDPLTFDAGLLQHGLASTGGAGGDGALLETAGEAPFYRELSVRVGHAHDFAYGPGPEGEDGDRVSWRLRFPVIQSLRYGRANTWGFQYRGEAHFRTVDPLSPRHEANVAFSWGRGARGPNHTHHLQTGVVVRDHRQAGLVRATTGLLQGARTGAVLRYAGAVELGRGVGPVAPALSPVELTLVHYGLTTRGDGRLDLSVLCPQVLWSTRRATWRAGLAPRMRMGWRAGEGLGISWAGMAQLAGTWVPRVE